MDDFNPSPLIAKEIYEWRHQSAYHLGFSDKEAWQEIQKERHEKTFAGKVEKKIEQAKTVTKQATIGVWQVIKTTIINGWNKARTFLSDNQILNANNIIVAILVIMSIMIIIALVLPDKNKATPSWRATVAINAPALSISDLGNFSHLVEIIGFYDDYIIEFMTEDESCLPLKFKPSAYEYIKSCCDGTGSRQSNDPRVIYAFFMIETERNVK